MYICISDGYSQSQFILLTEEGIRKAEEAARTRALRHEEMFSGLLPEEKDMLIGLLEKVNRDWEARYRDRRKHHHHGCHPHGHHPHDEKRGESGRA